MIQMIVIIICLASVITAIFSILWGWLILAIPSVFLLINLLSLKQKKWKYIPELSESANRMFQKFGHYYTMPFAGSDFSSAASTLIFAGIAITIIGVFKGSLKAFGGELGLVSLIGF